MKYKMNWQQGVMDNFSIEYYKNTADKYPGLLCHSKPDICNAPKDKRHCCVKEHSKHGSRGESRARHNKCKQCVAGDTSVLKPIVDESPKPKQEPPKTGQDSPKTGQDSPKPKQDLPKTGQDSQKPKQDSPKTEQESQKPKMNKEIVVNKLKNL